MARRSVVVLDSSGCKTGYVTYMEAQSAVDESRAVRVSERCIQLLPAVGEWRKKPSGGFLGAAVMQFEKGRGRRASV